MTNVPRRLPPTQGQRIRNVTVTHASLSGQGRTAAARPVPQQRPVNRIYQPPTVIPASNVVTGDSSGDLSVSIAGTATGTGESWATKSEATAVGHASRAYANNSLALAGGLVYEGADAGIAAGEGAAVGSDGAAGVALGPNTAVYGARGVAIGEGAGATTDQVVLGTTSHHVLVPGSLLLTEDGTTYWRVTVTGGTLGLIAYP